MDCFWSFTWNWVNGRGWEGVRGTAAWQRGLPAEEDEEDVDVRGRDAGEA